MLENITRREKLKGTDKQAHPHNFPRNCMLSSLVLLFTVKTDMLTVHAMGWNERKENGLHIALSSRFKKVRSPIEDDYLKQLHLYLTFTYYTQNAVIVPPSRHCSGTGPLVVLNDCLLYCCFSDSREDCGCS